MGETKFVLDIFNRTKAWREEEISKITLLGLTDLSYRPGTKMSSLGWVLAHQAAVYDFTLNFVIKGLKKGHSNFVKIFENYLPGTTGDWDGTDISKIQEYYDFCEQAFLDWLKNDGQDDLGRLIDDESIPKFFVGKTVRQVIADMFCHLNYHSGHLTAIRKDWISTH
ncbi:MAG: DinB family protein [Candidatus Thorarchaeota archaeon]